MKLRTRVKSHAAQVAGVVRDAANRAVVEVAEDVLAEINGNGWVPYEEGTLERSGEVTPFPGQTAAAITYDTPYAARQHEDRTLNHPRQGRHHWLEDTLEANADRYFQYIADALRKASST